MNKNEARRSSRLFMRAKHREELIMAETMKDYEAELEASFKIGRAHV